MQNADPVQIATQIHWLYALVTWAHLCVSFMLDAWMTTDSSIRALIFRDVACVFDYVYFSIE